MLIVLDQFEQWLHAKQEEDRSKLVEALRQCNGGRVQCLITVREDFWMAVTRFMRDVEIRLREGQNFAAVDLFDLRHARKVLAAFGRAFGTLPEEASQSAKEQKTFVQKAVAGLAQDGKVICVRLALFAEMIKGKPWIPATFKAVGGTAGLGVTFLEETFSAPSAPPEHRLQQRAARAVLQVLLPERGTNIRGHLRCYTELLKASGYARRPRDFEELLEILDGELRLVTPTDPEGLAVEDESPLEVVAEGKYYQLTHDYLVPALWSWLTRKQQQTRRGRAELRLADRSAIWNARPENRHLPSLWEWGSIRVLTSKKGWTGPQRKMLRKTGKYYSVRGLVLAVCLVLLVFGGIEIHGRFQAARPVHALAMAKPEEVPQILTELDPYRRWATPLLHDLLASDRQGSTARLYARLALLPVEPEQQKPLCGWFKNERRGESERFLAARILADYAADRPEMLADLLPDADEKQFAVLLPKLQDHDRRVAAGALQSALDERVGDLWKDGPLDPSFSPLDPTLVQTVEAADGMLDQRFGFCQTMRLDELTDLAEKLKVSGYRPIALCPYGVGKAARIAAVWTRDGREFRLIYGATAAEVQQQDAQCQQDGFVPSVLSHYALDGDDETGEIRYLGVWAKSQDDHPDITGGQDAAIRFGPGPTSISSIWKVKFYQWKSAGFAQPPADWDAVIHSETLYEQKVSEVNFDWGGDPPSELVPKDHFAMVATTELDLAAGEYFLETTSNDGVRVFVDDEMVINEWASHKVKSNSEYKQLPEGKHTIHIEYFEEWGDAVLRFRLSRCSGPLQIVRHAGESKGESLVEATSNPDMDHLLITEQSPRIQAQTAEKLASLGYRPSSIIPGVLSEQAAPVRSFFLWRRPKEPEDRLARQQANRAVALLRIGAFRQGWPMLKNSPDPSARSYIIHRLAPLGTDPQLILNKLDEEKETEVSIRRALILCLGEFGTGRPLRAEQEEAIPKLVQMYQEDPDPGIHGAAEWTLRRFGQDGELDRIDRELATGEIEGSRKWFVNRQGQTMTVISNPGEFLVGSPQTESYRDPDETLHLRRIDYRFAIANSEVTVRQFEDFRDGALRFPNRCPEPDCPIVGVTWYEAAAYCNWLSKKEGIPEEHWCYEPNDQGEFADGMRVRANYPDLTGYRLPTEPEWEYACRAGKLTKRHYGQWASTLLQEYAWYRFNSKGRSWPVRSLKPNDLGLFDVHGNAGEWCQESYWVRSEPAYPYFVAAGGEAPRDATNAEVVISTKRRAVRPSTCRQATKEARSAERWGGVPTETGDEDIGFRVARTMPDL